MMIRALAGVIAGGLTILVPADALPPGVTWLNPPAPGTDANAQDEKFVVFVREPVNEAEWDFIASAWEIIPGEVPTITPRVRFERSMWSPALLQSGPDAPRTDLVRLQIPNGDGGHGYHVNLYRIDYATWNVKTLWQGDQITDVCTAPNGVYVSIGTLIPTATSIRVLRLDTDTIEPLDTPFRYVRPLDPLRSLHLVQRVATPAGLYDVFDARAEQFLTSVALPVGVESSLSEVAIDDDLSHVAIHLVSDVQADPPAPIGEPRYAPSTIRVFDTKDGSEATIPIDLYAAPGSGVALILSRVLLIFSRSGHLHYTSYEPPDPDGHPGRARRFGVDLNRAPLRPIGLPDLQPPPSRLRVPEALVPFVHTPWPDEHTIAHAFLEWKGIDFDVPVAWSDTDMAMSPDGLRFALKMTNSRKDDVFFLGDLEAGTLRELAAPPSLRRANDLSIVCVP